MDAIGHGDRVELIKDEGGRRAGERGTVKSLVRSTKDWLVVPLHIQFDTAPPHTLTDTDPSAVKKL